MPSTSTSGGGGDVEWELVYACLSTFSSIASILKIEYLNIAKFGMELLIFYYFHILGLD